MFILALRPSMVSSYHAELPDLSELDGLLLHFGGGSEKSDSGYVFDVS